MDHNTAVRSTVLCVYQQHECHKKGHTVERNLRTPRLQLLYTSHTKLHFVRAETRRTYNTFRTCGTSSNKQEQTTGGQIPLCLQNVRPFGLWCDNLHYCCTIAVRVVYVWGVSSAAGTPLRPGWGGSGDTGRSV